MEWKTRKKVKTEESEEEYSDEMKRERQISVKLNDADILDCPVCFEPLMLPVFQCKNGHIACMSCCVKMSNKCGTCFLQIGFVRCRAIEKVIENLEFPCQNAPYGCEKTMLYNKKLEHENTCDYVPHSCPLCDYVGSPSGLTKHIDENHSLHSKQFTFASKFNLSLDVVEHHHITLRETTEDMIFVLNLSNEPLARSVNLVYAGRTLSNRRYPYSLVAKHGESSIKLDSVADNVPKYTATTAVKNSLLVPKNFVTSSGQIELEITIWRKSSS